MMDALLEVPAPDELPEGWRVGPVLDFFQLQRGHDLPVQDRRDGPVPVIASNGAVGFHDKSPLPGPGVVTGRSGTIGNVSFVEGAYWPLNTTLYVKDFKGTDPKFAYYFLQNFPLKDHQTGTGVPTLNRNDVHAVEVQFPPLDEQQRIAEVLRSVDEAIVAADLALAQTKQVRQSVVDVLLFPNNGHHRSELRRFRLSDLISIAHGFPFKSEYFTFERVDPILLTPGNFSVEKTLYFGERTKHYRGPVPDGYVLEEGSLVVVMTDLTQDMAILGNAIEIPGGSVILHNQRIGRVSLLKPDLIDLAYVRLLLNSEPVQSRIKATASGSTVRHTAPSRILECEIELPPLDEQARIVEIAKSLDDLVVAEERRRSNVEAIGALAHLRDLRGTIAADLLSGRVRVPQSNVVPIRSNVQPAFKRAVFAAEIVHQLHNDNKFGSVKHEKIVHLCELHIGLHDALDRHAYKEAAGPYDPKARRSVESIFAKQKWFKAHKPDGIRVVYAPLEKCGGHASYYDRFFGTHKTEIQTIIDLLRPLDTERCEIIATLYAVWNDFLIDGTQPTDQEIVTSVLTDWHPKKKQIAEGRWLRALPWMRQQQLIPSGKGEKTRVKAT